MGRIASVEVRQNSIYPQAHIKSATNNKVTNEKDELKNKHTVWTDQKYHLMSFGSS